MSQTAQNPASQAKGEKRGVDLALRLIFVITAISGIYFSGRLGIGMAKARTSGQATASESTPAPAGRDLTLGATGEPVYLAGSPEALRRFFSTYPSPGERASADLSGQEIRRINAYLLATTKRAEADAVEVVINSGAISGAVYWVHHTQVPDRTTIDPVIPPVPTSIPGQ